MNFYKPIFIFLLLLIVIGINAQVAVGEWRGHLPYTEGRMVAEAGDIIYCSTNLSLFYYNKSDKSVDKLSKINGLSDVGIKSISYNSEADVLLIAYENANIDLIKSDIIINLPDIKDKIMSGSKSINNIMFINKHAYLACGFGIVVVNLEKEEILDTYYIGEEGSRLNVLDLAFDGTSIFASTENGIYSADINSPNLANYSFWNKITDVPHSDSKYNCMAYFNGKLYANYLNETLEGYDTIYVYDYVNWTVWSHSDNTSYNAILNINNHLIVVNSFSSSAYDSNNLRTNYVNSYSFGSAKPNHAIIDTDGIFWIADSNYGLVRNTVDWDNKSIYPNGPFRNSVFDIDIKNGKLWVAGGSRASNWGNLYNKAGVYSYRNNEWTSFNKENTAAISNNIWDITEIIVDPSNSNHVFAGSWGGGGVIELLRFIMKQIVRYRRYCLVRFVRLVG